MSAAVLEAGVEAALVSDALNLVDEQHPWLGLDSFTEETRQFFFGREEEVAELARRVQRRTLAILFGQSGLGKTSILRAGIVPRLRREGFCPVYVRIDYSRESPAPSQQIKQAIFRATETLGKWTKPGSSVPGESLWEFLHHRDDVLMDERGNVLVPLLIFDQFEEIFTLGQMDDFGRERAGEFITDLADLVENRPPKALEMMLENEDSIVERFDFERADYRILIALREDYLAHLEGLKGEMPSITQNRMRLARMTGHQALAAVVKPGGRLVSEEVAESIVRFIAGGAELRNAEVEPSLLSLVCRELNNARIAQQRAEISADLLAGSRDTILNEFYERALADQPPGVRRFIEDEMLTESGFRESLAEERVLKGFAAANAMPTALPTLVNRRLLRIEERLDARRVELTHDVLCAVVKSSRDARLEREAREEAERQLEAQRAREEATRRSLVRTRYVAAGCAVLALASIASAIFGYKNMKESQETRTAAESARSEAEKLVVYLLEDFYLELEPVGRLDIVADLSKRAVAYYDGLPKTLRTAESERNRALALARYGVVLRRQAKWDESLKVLGEASQVLERLRAGGDASESAAIGQSVALAAYGQAIQFKEASPRPARPHIEKAVAVLAPLAARPEASAALRRAHAQALAALGGIVTAADGEEAGLKTLDRAREAFRRVDGLTFTDLSAAAGFVGVAASQLGALSNLRREEEAREIGKEALQVATRILETRPGHMVALRSRAALAGGLSFVELQDLRMKEAIALGEMSIQDYEALLKLDPGNSLAWNELATRRIWTSFAMARSGKLRESVDWLRAALEVDRRAGKAKSDFLNVQMGWAAGELATVEAELGNRRASEEALAVSAAYGEKAAVPLPKDSFWRGLRQFDRYLSLASLISGDFAAARDQARTFVTRVEPLRTQGEQQQTMKNFHLAWVSQHLGGSLLQLKDFAGAEAALRTSIRQTDLLPWHSLLDYVNRYDAHVELAVVLARQNPLPEARKVIEPVLEFHRKLPAEARGDLPRQLQHAQALYAAALASPGEARKHLAEAARVLDALPAEFARMKTVARTRAWITEEMARRS
jgi:tetratricopeptide (TPR) repeat protein